MSGQEDASDGNHINFVAAVREGKAIVAQQDTGQLRLGELADKVTPIYGQSTLKRFAKAIGINPETLARYRSVYRAWADIPAPGPGLSYAVMRELADHPQRAELVRANPTMTKREAAKIARQFANERRAPRSDAEVWRAWQAGLLVVVRRVRDARWSNPPRRVGVDLVLLRAIGEAARILTDLARQLEGETSEQEAA